MGINHHHSKKSTYVHKYLLKSNAIMSKQISWDKKKDTATKARKLNQLFTRYLLLLTVLE